MHFYLTNVIIRYVYSQSVSLWCPPPIKIAAWVQPPALSDGLWAVPAPLQPITACFFNHVARCRLATPREYSRPLVWSNRSTPFLGTPSRLEVGSQLYSNGGRGSFESVLRCRSPHSHPWVLTYLHSCVIFRRGIFCAFSRCVYVTQTDFFIYIYESSWRKLFVWLFDRGKSRTVL